VLTRTEVLLEEGDLDGAAREMNGLHGWAGVLSKDWVGECRRVLETRQALEVSGTRLMTSGTGVEVANDDAGHQYRGQVAELAGRLKQRVPVSVMVGRWQKACRVRLCVAVSIPLTYKFRVEMNLVNIRFLPLL